MYVYTYMSDDLICFTLSINYMLGFVAIFNEENDIATYTIKAVEDPRTVNKILYINPPNNIYSLNELVSLWEKMIGNKLERTYVSEEQLVQQIQGKLSLYCVVNNFRVLFWRN